MKIKPYSQNDYTPMPTSTTLYLRTCVVWQLIKFVLINIRMTLLILKSHH